VPYRYTNRNSNFATTLCIPVWPKLIYRRTLWITRLLGTDWSSLWRQSFRATGHGFRSKADCRPRGTNLFIPSSLNSIYDSPAVSPVVDMPPYQNINSHFFFTSQKFAYHWKYATVLSQIFRWWAGGTFIKRIAFIVYNINTFTGTVIKSLTDKQVA
jgi:hypothetical protein